MANEGWKTLPVEKIKADTHNAIAIGPFGSRMKAELYRPYGVPVIRGNNISKSKQFTNDFVFISEETASQLQTSVVFPNDLVFPHRGAIGEVGIVPHNGPKKFILSSSLMKLTCNTKVVDPLFLFYFFRSSLGRQELLKNASIVGTPGIATPLSSLRSIEVPVPPIIEQQNIARILGSLDDKIELNRQMNETLEAMARVIFQSWFVDFDPVRAKAEGRDTGLPPEVAALFPSEIVEVDGREVPSGWRYCRISDVVRINEKSIDQNYPHSTIEYIEISSVTEGKLESVTVTNRHDAPSRAQRLVNHGDTIWSGVRPNRKSYLFIQKPNENLVVSTGFITLSPKKIFPSYLYSWVTTELFVDYLTANADGSAYPAVRAEHFGDAEILLPDSPVLEQFEKIVAPMRAKKHHNDEESRTLAQIRDALLPKLMSGEIHING